MWEELSRLGVMPAWLAGLDDPVEVQTAMGRLVPGLQRARLGGVRLKEGGWTARCALALDGARPVVELAARIIPPEQGEPEPAKASMEFPGVDGWRGWVPELRLELLSIPEPESGLPSLELLTDPERARALLEGAIREGAPTYRDLRIVAASPRVMRYSPGSRCTVMYRLELPPEAQSFAWPDVVVAKTYHRSDKGRIAWDGMRALWSSPLAASSIVDIAEPLAWLPELRVLVQGPIRQERTLKELLLATLASPTGHSLDELRRWLARAAAGLVELHHSGAHSTERGTLEAEFAEVHGVLDRLTSVIPQLAGAADGFLEDLQILAALIPADPALPAHRSFRPAQVLLHGDRMGFIDFDGFCQAEPALDVALFRATMRELAMSVLPVKRPVHERLVTIDDLCDHFLACYVKLAPLSSERVVLWEALDLFTNVQHSWTKVKPARLTNAMSLLLHHARKVQDLRARA